MKNLKIVGKFMMCFIEMYVAEVLGIYAFEYAIGDGDYLLRHWSEFIPFVDGETTIGMLAMTLAVVLMIGIIRMFNESIFSRKRGKA